MLTDSLVSSRRLINGTVLNFMGQAVPLVIGVAALPFVIRGLGPERFGVFSLALAVLGTFGLLDLGMPRATTKFLAERLLDGDMNKFRLTFWTSLLIQCLLGVASGGILILLIPTLTSGVLKISPNIVEETRISLLLIALQVPFFMLTSGARGTLEAGQKFNITNALKIPLSSMMYVIPFIMLPFGLGLVEILLFILVARILIAGLHLFFCFRVYPVLLRFATDARLIRSLLTFGGWILVANMVATAMTSIDRFFIGSIETTIAVGYYSAPIDILNRLFILPTSLVTVLFPTFSALAHGEDQQLARIFAQAIKFLMLLMAPVSLFFAVFAHPILSLWLGTEFASQSTLVFQVVAVTVLISSIGWIPYALLQAIGRPDLPAKFMMAETPFFLGLLWVLIQQLGIVGAAIAWLIRVAAEVIWFLWALWHIRPNIFGYLLRSSTAGAVGAILVLTLLISLPIVVFMDNLLLAQFVSFFLAILIYGWVCWQKLLDQSERIFLSSWARRTVGRRA